MSDAAWEDVDLGFLTAIRAKEDGLRINMLSGVVLLWLKPLVFSDC
jgi:hypothetical protein